MLSGGTEEGPGATNTMNVEKFRSFDPVWESRYRDNPGHRNRYQWTSVVSFVYRYRPKHLPRADTRILEVGCGNGCNLWFAAREGFQVSGVDGSSTAIEYARQWFEQEGLAGDLRVGDYSDLPFESETFQLVIDRAGLSFCGRDAVEKAVNEINRVMVPGGRFMFTPYSDRCSSFDGLPDEDGCYRNVTSGSITPGAQVRFYSLGEVRELFRTNWRILKLEHQEHTSFDGPSRMVHAEWLVIAEKL